MTKPDTEIQAESAVDSEQVSTDTQATAQKKTDASTPRRKKRLGPWLFLALIFVALPAAWVFSPPELRQQAIDMFNAGKANLRSNQVTPPAPLPITDSQQRIDKADTAQEDTAISPAEDSSADAAANPSDLEPEASVDMATPLESAPQTPDNSASLQEEINRLQNELNSLQAEREQLLQQLKSGKADELRLWLSLLSSPDTRLSHRIGMWAYLSSLPSLNEAEQGKAREMGMMLQHARDKLVALRKSLKQLAESIPAEQQADIIPRPENSYLAWLVSAFHLRHAPSTIEQQQGRLRRQLQDMEHALIIEDWPEPRAWRRLLSAVRDQLGDTADAGLSESMDSIRVDIDVSRKTASDWMEAL